MKLHEVCNDFSFGLMKLKDVAKEIEVPETTFRTWRQRGDIPEDCFKIIDGSVFIKSKSFKNGLILKIKVNNKIMSIY